MPSLFKKIVIITQFIVVFSNNLWGHDYWQQRVVYKMSIDFDAKSHKYQGKQILEYYNFSPDTLDKVYYHLYLNAFQPNSMMDVRSRTLPDPDPRVEDRISLLKAHEIGYIYVQSLKQENESLTYEVSETVLEVKLATPILPGASATFTMQFDAQVPLQIRRTGRDSYEGVDYSMAQWYPKMAEYDEEGWHTSPYVAREFYAPWGDFDVDITIDKDYVIAATGVLQNPNEIGYGYEDKGVKVKRKGSKLTYQFKAQNVHDFVWAADKEYTQTTAQVPGGPLLRFFYIPGEDTKNWEELPQYGVRAFDFIQKNFGKYGWTEYAVIQGGDGGMEYPMATLIANKRPTGIRSMRSLIGVMTHEALHSWYQGMLATNESYYAWMDEGFTSFAEKRTEDFLFGETPEFPYENSYNSYFRWVSTGKEEPLTIHSDHFSTNNAYSVASYTKGALALEQLGYIIGAETRDKGLISYYNQWSFKHPDMNDFIKIMEKQSDLELSWYFDYWIKTTYTIDYGIDMVSANSGKSTLSLSRLKEMPMPLDIYVTKTNGEKEIYYIPLSMMLGEKPNETSLKRIICKDWPWTHPNYKLTIDIPLEEIAEIEIDPTRRMADINRKNNLYKKSSNTEAGSATNSLND